jgi:hypothetical protein
MASAKMQIQNQAVGFAPTWGWLQKACYLPQRQGLPLVIVSFVMAAILVMTLIVTATLIVTTALIVTATLVVTATLSMIVAAVLALVSRHVFVVVPVVAHEVDPAAAGVVLGAMPAPVVLVPWRHVKVNRRGRGEFRRLPDDHGLCIDQWWLRSVPDVDLAEESGLADSDRHADVAGNCRAGADPE